MSSSSGPVALLSGGLIDELEWVRTDISAFDSWKFVNHATQRAALNAIENSSVVPVPCRQN
jgi:hypothetical protein